MLDITAIILTYNEEIHIRRCLENVRQFAKKIYVVDCFSKDAAGSFSKIRHFIGLFRSFWAFLGGGHPGGWAWGLVKA